MEYPRILATVDAYDQITLLWADSGDSVTETIIPRNITDPSELAAVLLDAAQEAAKRAYSAGRGDALREQARGKRGLAARFEMAEMGALLEAAEHGKALAEVGE